MSSPNPIPTRFTQAEFDAIVSLSKRKGLTNADVIRRAVKLLYTEIQRNPTWDWIEATAPDLEETLQLLVAESQTPYGRKNDVQDIISSETRKRSARKRDKKSS